MKLSTLVLVSGFALVTSTGFSGNAHKAHPKKKPTQQKRGIAQDYVSDPFDAETETPVEGEVNKDGTVQGSNVGQDGCHCKKEPEGCQCGNCGCGNH